MTMILFKVEAINNTQDSNKIVQAALENHNNTLNKSLTFQVVRRKM